MELFIRQIPEHGTILVPVPAHLVKQPLSNYRTIRTNDNVYDILSCIVHNKGEQFPEALQLLSTGSLFEDETVWRKYPNINRLIFFICKKKK